MLELRISLGWWRRWIRHGSKATICGSAVGREVSEKDDFWLKRSEWSSWRGAANHTAMGNGWRREASGSEKCVLWLRRSKSYIQGCSGRYGVWLMTPWHMLSQVTVQATGNRSHGGWTLEEMPEAVWWQRRGLRGFPASPRRKGGVWLERFLTGEKRAKTQR